ncbi:Sodium channel protein PaFPC1 [Pseudolycoriella hygida]|uniref:Sodium channel protein PaFPC1 n=1 Tax=Pseudolycoriella hygida TaxID=35572 RepID=A0A9Q0N0Z4_9DIPT|nr:Sodium channel protein PaFPC1 [Pseudolycoriella hygida]
MDISSDEEPSSIFKPFTPQTTSSKENGNINKKTENEKALPTISLSRNDFEDCCQLPDGLKKCFSTELIGRPLDDPFYAKSKETFVVVNKNFQLFRFSSSNALGIFSPTSVIRSNAIRVLTNPFFTIFMVIVILAYCLNNALIQPVFDLRYFLLIFLLEFLLKITSQGLILSPFSYLRNAWNILDIILNILLICDITYYAELRILKIISYSLHLRQTIRLYWSSFKILRDLIIYMGLMLAILSTLFLQIYMGTLTQACVKSGKLKKKILFVTISREYLNLGETELPDEIIYCGNSSGSRACPDTLVCMQGSGLNPDYGYTSFDTIALSFLSTFRLVTRDFWEDLLHLIIATTGPWHILSFIVVIFIISYQVMSLIWGQIAISYNYIRLERWEQSLICDDVDAEDATSQETKTSKDAGCWSKVQRFFFFIIYNPYVVLFVIICIILNTLCMALDHHNMSRELETTLRLANYIFVVIFVIEAILKLLALGVVRYFKDEWNSFDFIVTLFGAIELVLEGVQGLSVLRSFRLLRPLRLGKVVPAFDLILTRMHHLFSVVKGQTFILFMAIYIFVVFGRREFGEDFEYRKDRFADNELPLWRFTDIMHSFMVVFRALCGEWIETMFQVLLVASNSWLCVIYYFLLVTCSSFQIMHIFTALLFTNDDSTAISSKKSEKSVKPKEKFKLGRFLKDKLLEPSIRKIYDEYRPRKDVEANGENPSTKMVTKAVIEADFIDPIDSTDTTIPIEPASANTPDIALKTNKNKYFEHLVTLCIIVASFTLTTAVGINAHRYPLLVTASFYIEFVFIGMLTIELMTKLSSRGWKLCVTDVWYWVDLLNVILALIGMFVYIKEVEVLLALRPLSLIPRCTALSIIANAVVKQMWFLVNTLLVCLAFWLIFAIMGVQLFAGKFYSCVDSNGARVESVANRSMCDDDDMWVNSFMNFDDVIQSYYSLLQVSTFKGWISIINDAVDSRYVDATPIKETNIYMFFYFVVFIACCVFVCVNVIVGMLLQHMLHFGSLCQLLNKDKAESEEPTATTDATDPSPSNNKLINFVRSHVFEKISFAVYLVYVIALMVEFYQSPDALNTVLSYIQLALSILLILEVSLRAFAYRKGFLTNPWNRFDMVLIIFIVVDSIVLEVTVKYFVSTYLLWIVRIFRFNGLIASWSTTLQRCGNVVAKTWKTVSMLYLFLFLIICVYAIIGMTLYGENKIEFSSTDIINFQSFGQSVILLIQVSTGAGWDGLLQQIVGENSAGATLYMLSFLYISFTILINVTLVIAFEFYKEVTSSEDERKKIQPDDLKDFNEKWKQFAQNGQRYVPKNRLGDFFNALNETSGLRHAEYNEKEFELLGVKRTADGNYTRSALLVALNRIRLNKPCSA